MLLFTICLGIAAAGAAVLGLGNQRSIWWATRAPFFMNPEANEPSDGAYGLQRLGLFVLAVALAACALGTLHEAGKDWWSAGEIRDAANQVAQTMQEDTSDTLLDPDIAGTGATAKAKANLFRQYLTDGLPDTEEGKENFRDLSVSRDQSENGPTDLRHDKRAVENYTISDRGKHPVCMTVTGTRSASLSYPDDPDEKADVPAYYWDLSGKVADGAC